MRRMLAPLLASLAILCLPTLASAQQYQPAFKPQGGATLSVTVASARVALPTAGPTALIINTGANAAYIKFGNASITAATTDYLLGAGCSAAYDVNGQADVAAITGSSTTTLSVITGAGIPPLPVNVCASNVTVTPSGTAYGSPTDKGGTISVGGTAQTAIAVNASRKAAACENPVSATEDLYISVTGSATVGGAGNYADLAPGGSANVLGTTAVSVNAATANHRFLCTEWQ